MPAYPYERLGGQDAVKTAVDIFYRKILADALIISLMG